MQYFMEVKFSLTKSESEHLLFEKKATLQQLSLSQSFHTIRMIWSYNLHIILFLMRSCYVYHQKDVVNAPDPFHKDEDAEVEALARKFEEKYVSCHSTAIFIKK